MYHDIPSPDPLRLLVQPDNCVGPVVYPECTRFDIQITLKQVSAPSTPPKLHFNARCQSRRQAFRGVCKFAIDLAGEPGFREYEEPLSDQSATGRRFGRSACRSSKA